MRLFITTNEFIKETLSQETAILMLYVRAFI